MAKVYRTQTDKKIQAANRRMRAKQRRYEAKGIRTEPPLIDPHSLSNLTGSQKLARLRAAERYMETQFVAGYGGVGLDKRAVRQYMARQERLNQRNLRLRQRLDDQTRAFNEIRYGPESEPQASAGYRSVGMQKPGPLAPRTRRQEDFVSQRALDRANADLERRLSPNFRAREARKVRESLHKMTDATEQIGISDRVAALRDEQLEWLFNATKFMDLMGVWYVSEDSNLMDSLIDEADELLELAEQR